MSEQMTIPMAPNGLNPMVSQPGQYVFPTYWGGMAVSPTPPQIHAKLHELRAAVGGLVAKKAQGGPMFPVRSAKELTEKLAQALHELDMVAPVISQEVHYFDTDKIPSNSTSSGKPVFRTLAHVRSTVRVGAPDGSYVDMVGSGHGGDVDDKAGGKASTYGWKDAILKGLTVGEKDMVDTDDDASDEPSPKTIPFRGSDIPKKVAKAMDAPGPDLKRTSGDLADVIDAIGKASQMTKADGEMALEAIKNDITSGKIALAGADKLRASTAFVQAKQALSKKTE